MTNSSIILEKKKTSLEPKWGPRQPTDRQLTLTVIMTDIAGWRSGDLVRQNDWQFVNADVTLVNHETFDVM